jgi:hypothetical protein
MHTARTNANASLLSRITQSEYYPEDIGRALQEAFVATDVALYSHLSPKGDVSGTTAVSVLLKDGKVWLGSVFFLAPNDGAIHNSHPTVS